MQHACEVQRLGRRAAWRAEAERLGIDLAGLRRAANERVARGAASGQPAAGEPLQQARASVAWAVEHLGERQAAFRAMDLAASALSHGAARGPGLDEIRAAVAAHPGLIKRLSPTK